ncbi:hypothetical protein B0H14DRAFT_3144637 [Mycena olivaceomarginata]|nr:hypothetical protein B0H14DRAFT_3144637 [Mycena olivaceomarginata]
MLCLCYAMLGYPHDNTLSPVATSNCAYVEYPESGIDGPIGHLIPDVDSTDADSTARIPWTDFAYSHGAPEGGTLVHEMIYTPLLVDEAGNPVLCRIRHSTCLGVKACSTFLQECSTSSIFKMSSFPATSTTFVLCWTSRTTALPAHEEDEPLLLPEEKSTRIIICMTPHSSSRLQKAQYLQSDIGFKRIVGYDEFEISAMDRDANTSLGLYLVDRAAALPPGQMDLHESWRTLRSLGPYEHLRRIYRLCKVHNYRNIQTCSISDPVRQLMRSLACIEHPSWDATIAQIIADGGKAGADWVRDKVTSKFAFPGICWEKSFIPFPVWQVGEPNTNLAEAVHSDVNCEGVHCTLLGGLLRGQDYDAMQHETLLQYEQYGIRPSYNPVAPVMNTLKNLKRKGLQQAKKVQASMKAVSEHNINLHRAHAGLAASLQNLEKAERAAANPVLPHACSSQLVRP